MSSYKGKLANYGKDINGLYIFTKFQGDLMFKIIHIILYIIYRFGLKLETFGFEL